MSLFGESRAGRNRFLFYRMAPIATARSLLNRSHGMRAIRLGRAVTRQFRGAACSAILSEIGFGARLQLIYVQHMTSDVDVSFAVVRYGALCGLVRIYLYRVLITMCVVGFLLRRLEVDRFQYRIAIVYRRRCAYNVAIRASCQVSALLTDAFRRVRRHLAFLQIVQDHCTVFQFVGRCVCLALGVCQLVIRLRLVQALRLYARFHCSFAVCECCSYDSGLVHFAAETSAYVHGRLIRAGQLVQVDRRFFMLSLLLRAVFYVQIMINDAQAMASL